MELDAGKTAFIESKGIETSVSVLCSTGDATIRELSSEILEQVVEEGKNK